MRTISGGYHKVFKYTEEVNKQIQSGTVQPIVLCDVLCNGKGFTFGEGYKILHKIEPIVPPKSVINFISYIQNNIQNAGSIIGSQIGSPIAGSATNNHLNQLPLASFPQGGHSVVGGEADNSSFPKGTDYKASHGG
jgi:hypothetical protein